jgi:hypothetical protein
MRAFVFSIFLWLTVAVSIANADIGGLPPEPATAVSADGCTVVRVENGTVKVFSLDSQREKYSVGSSFKIDRLPASSELLFVSNHGEYVVIAYIGGKDAIRVYRRGKLLKTWMLSDFLTQREIDACAETGSTLQWFERGVIDEAVFFFEGPSTNIKGLRPSFTVMRGMEEGMSFSFRLDLKSMVLERQPDESDSPDIESAKAAYDRGVSHYDKREFDGAIASFTVAIRFNPRYAAAYERRGAALKAKGEEDIARAKKLGYHER